MTWSALVCQRGLIDKQSGEYWYAYLLHRWSAAEANAVECYTNQMTVAQRATEPGVDRRQHSDAGRLGWYSFEPLFSERWVRQWRWLEWKLKSARSGLNQYQV